MEFCIRIQFVASLRHYCNIPAEVAQRIRKDTAYFKLKSTENPQLGPIHLVWNGGISTSDVFEIPANDIFDDGCIVNITQMLHVPEATDIEVAPCSSYDWAIIETCAGTFEQIFLSEVGGIVHVNQVISVKLNASMVSHLLVISCTLPLTSSVIGDVQIYRLSSRTSVSVRPHLVASKSITDRGTSIFHTQSFSLRVLPSASCESEFSSIRAYEWPSLDSLSSNGMLPSSNLCYVHPHTMMVGTSKCDDCENNDPSSRLAAIRIETAESTSDARGSSGLLSTTPSPCVRNVAIANIVSSVAIPPYHIYVSHDVRKGFDVVDYSRISIKWVDPDNGRGWSPSQLLLSPILWRYRCSEGTTEGAAFGSSSSSSPSAESEIKQETMSGTTKTPTTGKRAQQQSSSPALVEALFRYRDSTRFGALSEGSVITLIQPVAYLEELSQGGQHRASVEESGGLVSVDYLVCIQGQR